MRSLIRKCLFAVGITCLLLTACNSPQSKEEPGVQTSRKGPLTSFSEEITSPIQHIEMKAAGTFPMEITVKNTGTEAWSSGKDPFSVDAGYRWFDAVGTMAPMEGVRTTPKAAVVAPGQSETLQLQVVAPATPGAYTLIISMVQEQVSWFFVKGATPLKISALVK